MKRILFLILILFTVVLYSQQKIENEGLKTFRRLNSDDIDLIEILQDKGQLPYVWFQQPENEKYSDVLKRCKARGLVVPIRKGTAYWYDLTDFGYNMLSLVQAKKQEGIYAPKASAQQAEQITIAQHE